MKCIDITGFKKDECSLGSRNQVNVNASPYTDFASIPNWGQYAYGPSGCAWFASARVRQLTGKGNMIYSGSSWYNSEYSSYGFSRGSELKAPALLCWEGHVAVLEKIDGDIAYISEGGMSGYGSNASTGYTIIRAVSKFNVTSSNTNFLGFVYLENPNPVSKATLSADKATLCAGSLTFRCEADGGYEGQIDIYKEGYYYKSISAAPNTQVTEYFDYEGSYHALYSAYDGNKRVNSEPINFTVHNTYTCEPKDMDVGLEKKFFAPDEHVTVYMFSKFVCEYSLKIYRNGEKIDECVVPAFHNCTAGNTYRTYYFEHSGSYYITAQAINKFGKSEEAHCAFVVSEKVDKPDYVNVDFDKQNFSINDDVTIYASGTRVEYYNLSVKKDGKEVKRATFYPYMGCINGATYVIYQFSDTGNYDVVLTAINSKGSTEAVNSFMIGKEPEPEPTDKPEAIATPEPTDKPEAIATPEPTDKPEAIATPEPTDKPEAIATPEPTDKPEAIATPEPTNKPEAIDTPEPADNLGLVPSTTPPAVGSDTAQVAVAVPTLKPSVTDISNFKNKLKITNVKKNGKGGVNVSWTWAFSSFGLDIMAQELLCTNKYQIQYSTKKNFNGKKTKNIVAKYQKISYRSTIKKLKSKKTYYFRVRSCGIIDGKVVYGKWSNVRKIKVK